MRLVLPVALLVIAATGAVLSGWPTPARADETKDAVVGGYELVSGRRVGRTVFEYAFRARITNQGQSNLSDVTATLIGAGANVRIVDSSLTFGSVGTKLPVPSTDTFTIRIDRRRPFDPAALNWRVEFYPQFEEYPGWRIPDLAVAAVSVDPERADPGNPVTLRATVANVGRADTTPAIVVFRVDGEELARVDVSSLARGAQTSVEVSWSALGAGRHWVVAELVLDGQTIDRVSTNNSAAAVARVSGGTPPLPALEFGDIDIDGLRLVPGTPGVVRIPVRNPGFAPVTAVPVFFLIDGQPLTAPAPPTPGGDVIITAVPDAWLDLAPGESRVLEIPWQEVTTGQHLLQLLLALPPEFEDGEFQRVQSWQLPVPGPSVAYNSLVKDRWVSIGPQGVVAPASSQHTNFGVGRTVGRMDRIAFDLDHRGTLYASAPHGGVWKTSNDGADWAPVGDGLGSLNARAIAVDPGQPNNVYVATYSDPNQIIGGSSGYGIYKSINGAKSWFATPFAPRSIVGKVAELVIRRTADNNVLIYASTDQGLLRYRSANPGASRSQASEWTTLRAGNIIDLAVHPQNLDILYATQNDAIWRSRDGGDHWDRISNNPGMPLFNGAPVKTITLDLWDRDPKTIFAAVTSPLGQSTQIDPLPALGLYESRNEGGTWTYVVPLALANVNVFLRVHPTQRLVYWGGLHLLRRYVGTPPGSKVLQDNVHDDIKALEFDPFDSRYYYLLSDGGISRCESRTSGKDPCVARNNNLRVTMFYDIDASQSNPNRMLGGTQDEGTLMYQGTPIWKLVKGGDGLYTNIASGNVLYAQHQRLRDTVRCDKGDACGWDGWKPANGHDDKLQGANSHELPVAAAWYLRDSQITGQPNDPDQLISMGDQVYATSDGGSEWYPQGPTALSTLAGSPAVRGHVSRVAYQPGSNDWIAGTSGGQIWHSDRKKGNPFDNCPCWDLLFEHPLSAVNPTVTNLAFAPTDANVLYATFNIGATKPWTRLYRIHVNAGSPNPAVASIMGAGFPLNLTPQAIAGDGHAGKLAYAGTNQGGVWRWDATVPHFGGTPWTPYNDGLPPHVSLTDLLVDPVSKQLRAATWGRGAWEVTTGP